MFDRLIESNSTRTNTGDRRGYFAVSTFLMSLVLIAGLLVSIFGANFDIGNADLDFAQLLAPIETRAPEPDPEPPAQQQDRSDKRVVEMPERRVAIQRIDVPPSRIVPVSTVPNKYKEMPAGAFKFGNRDVDPPYTGSGRPDGTGISNGTNRGNGTENQVSAAETAPPPLPIKKREPAKDAVVSLGAVNGKATSLPKPAYPATAKLVKAQGAVQIQISIEKDGSVTSAKAISGHPMLRRAAEDAAKSARFTPTLLSGEPVRATGVITYNFKLS